MKTLSLGDTRAEECGRLFSYCLANSSIPDALKKARVPFLLVDRGLGRNGELVDECWPDDGDPNSAIRRSGANGWPGSIGPR
jgi:hypothetical protein